MLPQDLAHLRSRSPDAIEHQANADNIQIGRQAEALDERDRVPVSALIGLREGQTDPTGRAGHDRGSGVHGAPFGSAPVEGGERVVAGVGEHRV